MHDPSTAHPGLLQLHRRVGRAAFAFSGRSGGVSSGPFASLNLGLHVGDAEEAVLENRRRLFAALGMSLNRLVEAEQAHGAGVATVTEAWLREHAGARCVAPGADALVTAVEGAVLSLYFADCVPVFLGERTGRVIGLAHAGWQGTARRVTANTVDAVCGQFGVVASRIVAVIGPCVGACCYEVGEEVVKAVSASLPARSGTDTIAREAGAPGKWFLDLAEANRIQLQDAGVPGSSIEITNRCTCCERASFFSARGDGRRTGRCGAFAYVAVSA